MKAIPAATSSGAPILPSSCRSDIARRAATGSECVARILVIHSLSTVPGRFHRHLVSHVTAEADSLSARRDDPVYRALHPIRVKVERPDPISVSSEAPGRGAPDA